MKVEKLTKEHLLAIDLQEHQLDCDFNDEEYIKILLNNGDAYAIVKDDKVLFCGGFYEETKDRALMWALLSKHIKHDMLSVHRIVKRYIQNTSYYRLYARVNVDFLNGIRWVESLKMEFEGIEKQFVKGMDFAIFSRIKGD